MITEKESKRIFAAKAVIGTILFEMKMRYMIYGEDNEFWEKEEMQIKPFGVSAVALVTVLYGKGR